ncbi:hypothetical protein IWW55_006312, partial [Coemansia sp. RSA 2706]
MTVTVYPDSAEAVLYGGPGEADCAVVTGRVVVTGKHAAQVEALTVTLRGQRARVFQAQQALA